jgi:hypothetical protein
MLPTIALFRLGGPVHALAVGEGGDVGVGVDAQSQVAAPHAVLLCAAAAAVVMGARRSTLLQFGWSRSLTVRSIYYTNKVKEVIMKKIELN